MSGNSKPTQNGSVSFELTDWLDTTQRLDGAATEGPWAVKAGEVVARVDESPWPPQIAYATATGDVSFQPEDAEFIAWSRTALPAAVAALRSVLDMHVKVVTDRHVAGPTAVCEPCSEDRMFAVWPCPTVAAITEALGEE